MKTIIFRYTGIHWIYLALMIFNVNFVSLYILYHNKINNSDATFKDKSTKYL